MSVDRSFRVLNLYDVLTELIPGVVLVGISAIIFPVGEYIPGDTATNIFVVGIGGYVGGHLIQFLRSKLYDERVWFLPDPRNFTTIARQLSMPGRRRTDIGPIDEIERAFLPLCRERFDLSKEFTDWRALFRMIMTYLETQPESRAVRLQALHSFCWSMAVSSFLVGVVAAIAYITRNVIPTQPWYILLPIFVGGMITAIAFELRRRKFNRVFINYVISDFYVSQQRDQE